MKKSFLFLLSISVAALLLASCAKEKNSPLPEAPLDHIHQFSEWTTLRKVTCETDGLKTRSCECGEVQIEAVTTPGHAVGNWVTVDPDCENEGAKYRKCKACNKELDRQVIPALGHVYVAEVFEPTYDLVGYTTYT